MFSQWGQRSSFDLIGCKSSTQRNRGKKKKKHCTSYPIVSTAELHLKVWVCYLEPRCTFTVGVIISQWAEAIFTNAAVSCLQIHAVGVLHAAMALRAEVMTCRRHREEKVGSQRREEAGSGKVAAYSHNHFFFHNPLSVDSLKDRNEQNLISFNF